MPVLENKYFRFVKEVVISQLFEDACRVNSVPVVVYNACCGLQWRTPVTSV
jgi:hypothetical protein